MGPGEKALTCSLSALASFWETVMTQNKLTCDELKRKVRLLEKESEQRKRFEDINATLFTISNSVNMTSNLDELFQSIHKALSSIIDTTNFYIALYDIEVDGIIFPYIVDSVDHCYPSVLNVSKTSSLTAAIIKSGEPLLITKSDILRHQANSPLTTPCCSPAEIWLGVPLKTKGKIIGVMAVQSYTTPLCYDQTDLNVMVAVADQVAIALDRKQKDEALHESEKRFRRIVTTANEGVLSLDANWSIIYANSHLAKMLGYEDGELTSKSLEEILEKEELTVFYAQRQECIHHKNSRFECKFKTRKKQTIYTLVSATAIFTPHGKFDGFFGMITDITALKKTEETLQEKINELNLAIDQIKTLRGIVPICMSCKKIRDDRGFWNQVEVYVKAHTEAEFSHGICPDCLNELYPELAPAVLKKD